MAGDDPGSGPSLFTGAGDSVLAWINGYGTLPNTFDHVAVAYRDRTSGDIKIAELNQIISRVEVCLFLGARLQRRGRLMILQMITTMFPLYPSKASRLNSTADFINRIEAFPGST